MSRLLASSAAVALLTGTAFAADLPLPVEPTEPAPVVAPGYDWTGFYVGGHGGWAWGESELDVTVDGLGFVAPPSNEFDIEGWLAGGQIGYDFQSGMWVFGVVGDASWTDIDGFEVQSGDDGFETNVEWVASIRGRVGVALNRFLPYVTGGLAFGEIDATVGDVDFPGPFFDPVTGIATGSEIGWGWTAGGGVEVGITDWVSVGGEYRYTDIEADFNVTDSTGANTQFDADARFHSVRGVLNVRF